VAIPKVPADPTALLLAWNRGEPDALDALLPLVYEELRRLAGRYMKQEREGHSLQANGARERGLSAAHRGLKTRAVAEPRAFLRNRSAADCDRDSGRMRPGGAGLVSTKRGRGFFLAPPGPWVPGTRPAFHFFPISEF